MPRLGAGCPLRWTLWVADAARAEPGDAARLDVKPALIQCRRGGVVGEVDLGAWRGRRRSGLPLEVAESPRLEAFRNRGNVALRDAVSGRGGDGLVDGLDGSSGLFQP